MIGADKAGLYTVPGTRAYPGLSATTSVLSGPPRSGLSRSRREAAWFNPGRGLPAYLQTQPSRPQQSSLQLVQFSLPLQLPSPQKGRQTPQSLGQLAQVSPPLQVPSPQTIHGPQSLGQLAQVSPPLQLPSPQTIHGPQSLGQLAQVSPPLQVPLPQMGVNVDVTEVAEVTVTVHVPVPLQPPPLQPLKVEPADGDAVSVIMVP